MNQDSITEETQSDLLFVPLYIKKDTTASLDSVSDLKFKDYVVRVLNDSFPVLKTEPSLLQQKTYAHNPKMTLKPIENTNQSQDWAFLVLVTVFAFLAVLFRFFRYRSFEIVHGCLSVKSFEMLTKSSNNIIIPAAIAFFPLIALGLYSVVDFYELQFDIGYKLSSLQLYLVLLVALTAYFCVKFLLIYFFGTLFRSVAISRLYIINQLTFLFLYSLILFLPICLSLFADNYIRYYVLIFIGGLFAILSLIRVVRGLFLVFNFSKFSRVYLFLYLCIVEFVPLFFVAKILLS